MVDTSLEARSSDSSDENFLVGNVFDLLGAAEESEFDHESLIGKKLGDYELLECVGSGGFGTVFKAILTHKITNIQTKVAVKVLHRPGQSLPKLKRETAALQGLQQENVVAYQDAGISAEGIPYLVMQWIDGESIGQYYAGSNHSWRAKVKHVIQACRAVEHAHSRGILHCDIKPQNILIDANGRVVLTDFGLARSIESDDASMSSSAAMRGTMAYMAPEQIGTTDAKKGVVSVGSDLFSLAATLCELLSGRKPRTGTHLENLASLIRRDSIEGLTTKDLSCPAQLVAVMKKALQVQPEDRYSHVSAFREDLENVLANRLVTARRAGIGQRALAWFKREPLLASISTLAVGLLVIVAGLSFWAWRSAARENQYLQEQFETARGFERLLWEVGPEERLSRGDRETFLKLVSETYLQMHLAYPDNKRAAYKYAQSEFNFTNYLFDRGNWQEAKEHIANAEKGFQELYAAGFEPEITQFDLFHTYNRMAAIENMLGNKSAAGELTEIAMGYLSRLIEEYPNNPEYRGCLASALNYSALGNYDAKDREWIEDRYRRARKLATENRKIAEANPLQWKHRVMASHQLAGIARRAGELDIAQKEISDAISWSDDILDALPEEHPDKWAFFVERVGLGITAGRIHLMQDKFSEAKSQLEDAQPYLDWLLENRSDSFNAKEYSRLFEQLLERIESEL